MKPKCSLFFMFLLFVPLIVGAQAISPDQYLGYTAGTRYTHYDRVLDYFRMLDSASQNVMLMQYGQTNEHRPQFVAIISSSENLQNIEEIRNNNLALAGLANPDGDTGTKLIIWLSYNVHGNEASSTEAAMETAWRLLNDEQVEREHWLEKAVIILAPCLNPDGRERYIGWFEQKTGIKPDPDPASEEHDEPWPGGRTNHYMFDLNRDWAWMTQVETRNLVRFYNRWMPQIHVDFHEQGINDPYYFAPAARPYHDLITPWQRSFQKRIGENNARHFDENGWLYFTKERFDLFYPGYGDTYPTFNGAIGMTYEQAGGPQSGLAVITETGDTLTLRDRILHHTASGLATIEEAVNNAPDVIGNFKKYFSYGGDDFKPDYNAFVVSNLNSPYKIEKLKELLNGHQIRFGYSTETKYVQGYDYSDARNSRYMVHAGDLVIPVRQPKYRLTEALFDPEARLEDSLTYDITAWSVPFAYGLNACAATEQVNFNNDPPQTKDNSYSIPENLYALAVPRSGFNDLKIMAGLLQEGIKISTNTVPVQFRGVQFPRGSFFISKADNKSLDLKDLYNRIEPEYPGRLVPLTSGLAQSGEDLGSPGYKLMNNPEIGLLTGPEVYSSECGEIWYFLENELGFPVHRIRADDLTERKLSSFDIIIFPSGDYSKILDENCMNSLKTWIGEGGRLIATGQALMDFAGKEGFSLKLKSGSKNDSLQQKNRMNSSYAEKDRMELKDIIAGGIFRVNVDNTHPLAYGYGNWYYSLKFSTDRYEPLENGWNVGKIINPQSRVSGFAGSHIEKQIYNQMEFGVEEIGSGKAVFMVDDPLFRDFWEGGKMLFANAVLMPF